MLKLYATLFLAGVAISAHCAESPSQSAETTKSTLTFRQDVASADWSVGEVVALTVFGAALSVAAAFALRRFKYPSAGRQSRAQAVDEMRLLATVHLSAGARLLLVEVSGKRIIVGQTRERITFGPAVGSSTPGGAPNETRSGV